MSIETDLNRMATSLEEIARFLATHQGSPLLPVSAITGGTAPTATLGGKRTPKTTPAPAPAIAVDEITGQPIAAVEATPVPTLDEVHIQLRALKDSPKGGIEACKKVMIEFGADKTRPVISSIPPANYVALMAKIGTLI